MRRLLTPVCLLAVLLLVGCHWPWHSSVLIKPGETKAMSAVEETVVPIKRKGKIYRLIIRPPGSKSTTQPAGGNADALLIRH